MGAALQRRWGHVSAPVQQWAQYRQLQKITAGRVYEEPEVIIDSPTMDHEAPLLQQDHMLTGVHYALSRLTSPKRLSTANIIPNQPDPHETALWEIITELQRLQSLIDRCLENPSTKKSRYLRTIYHLISEALHNAKDVFSGYFMQEPLDNFPVLEFDSLAPFPEILHRVPSSISETDTHRVFGLDISSNSLTHKIMKLKYTLYPGVSRNYVPIKHLSGKSTLRNWLKELPTGLLWFLVVELPMIILGPLADLTDSIRRSRKPVEKDEV
ncbi:MAG: hypothetical protein A2048_04430 [Deltaproteobacteria bacterium GWA2_45_12]|nr:MAG: hypothetical protein A2048_04430 [Deltaproteobacteria bacterium GWA2_45_12]